MNYTCDYILLKEFKSIHNFIKNKYNISLLEDKKLIEFMNNCILLLLSLKIWKEHLEHKYPDKEETLKYFQEMISNILDVMVLVPLEMKIPSLFLIRRIQELSLKYIYFFDHQVECVKKEEDLKYKNIKNLQEIKEYIKNYPYSKKYNIDQSKLSKLIYSMLSVWDKSYEEMSNFVHASNTSYLDNFNYLNEFKFENKDMEFINNNLINISSVINTLFIIFHFKEYVQFKEYPEKSVIRSSISQSLNYKRKIIEIFKEI